MPMTARPSLRQAFQALRGPTYRLYWSGQLASQTGTWMQSVAQAWLVLKVTNSPLALGTVAMVQFSPILLLSLVGGVLADRVPKRKLLIVTQSVMLLQALTLAVLTWSGAVQLWHIYVLAAVLGTANALDNPTRQAFVRDLVPAKDLPNAIALNSTQFNLSRIMGPALSGVLISLVGVAGSFAVNAVSSLCVIGALLRIRPEHEAPPAPARASGFASQIGEGLRYALSTHEIALVMLLTAVIGTFGYNFSVVLPLIAEFVLHADPIQFGGLTTAMGVGSLTAALGLAATGRATRRSLFGGAAGFSVLLAVVGLSPWWLLTIPALVLLGMFSIVFSTTANTRLQLVAPTHLRGRVMSIYMLLFAGSTPIGGLLMGTLAERWGVPFAVATAATICGVGVMAAWIYARRHRADLTFDSSRPDLAEPVAARPAAGKATEPAQAPPGD